MFMKTIRYFSATTFDYNNQCKSGVLNCLMVKFSSRFYLVILYLFIRKYFGIRDGNILRKL